MPVAIVKLIRILMQPLSITPMLVIPDRPSKIVRSHSRRAVAAVTGAALLVLAGPTYADTIGLDDCSQHDCGLYGAILHVSGEIKAGDAYAASMSLNPILDANDRVLAMMLDTTEGDIAEAMELGHMARQLDMVVIVPQGTRCLNLCLAILAGGVRRDIRGLVGLSGKNDRDELDALGSAPWFYFNDMHVAPSLLRDWKDWASGAERIFSQADLDRYGLTAVDPVWQTERDVWAANNLDIPLTEYQARQALMNASGRMSDCAALTDPDEATDCEHDLLLEFDLIAD